MDPRVYSRRVRASSWTLVPRRGWELPGAEQVRRAAPLDPDQLQEVNIAVIRRAPEPADLGGAELRGLVQHDAGGLMPWVQRYSPRASLSSLRASVSVR
jgi:hypothetical protein